jgi:hypothetical protein
MLLSVSLPPVPNLALIHQLLLIFFLQYCILSLWITDTTVRNGFNSAAANKLESVQSLPHDPVWMLKQITEQFNKEIHPPHPHPTDMQNFE